MAGGSIIQSGPITRVGESKLAIIGGALVDYKALGENLTRALAAHTSDAASQKAKNESLKNGPV